MASFEKKIDLLHNNPFVKPFFLSYFSNLEGDALFQPPDR